MKSTLPISKTRIDRFVAEMKDYIIGIPKESGDKYEVTIEIDQLSILRLFHTGVYCGMDVLLKDEKQVLDYSKITDIKLDDVDPSDYPDFSDAHIVYAKYGLRDLTEEELDELNQDKDFVYNCVTNQIF